MSEMIRKFLFETLKKDAETGKYYSYLGLVTEQERILMDEFLMLKQIYIASPSLGTERKCFKISWLNGGQAPEGSLCNELFKIALTMK